MRLKSYGRFPFLEELLFIRLFFLCRFYIQEGPKNLVNSKRSRYTYFCEGTERMNRLRNPIEKLSYYRYGFTLATLICTAVSGWLLGGEAVYAEESPQSISTSQIKVDPRIQEFTLENGWKFIVMSRHETPTISFYTYADVGSSQEVKGITGAAHLLEHLAFKGTPEVGTTDYTKEKLALEALDQAYAALEEERSKGEKADSARVEELMQAFVQAQAEAGQYVVQNEFGSVVESFGGTGLNASTSPDRTDYFFSLPSNAAELWFYLESGRFYEPVFREFYKERDVVTEERRMRTESSPIGFAIEEMLAAAYKAHPYGEPTVGHYGDLRAMTPAKVMDFFKTHYVPSNMISVIVGDITLERAQALAKAYFERIPARPRPAEISTVEPEQNVEKCLTLHLQSQPIYLEGYHRPSINHPDDVVYDALISILSEGRSSRLYRSLVRDRQLAIAAQGMSGEPGLKYPTLVLFYAVPAPGHSNEEVAAALHEELDKLIQTPVTEEELNGVKSRVRYALVSSLTTNSGWASLLGNYQGLTGDWRNLFKTIEKIERVTPEDIQRVARETFRPTNRTAVYIETAMQEGSNPVLSKE